MDVLTALLIGLGSSFAASIVGGLLTANSIESWYRGLKKPSWNPPDWVFGPVWLTLYLLMGLAFALILLKSEQADAILPSMFFAAQLILNVAWNWFFFSRHMLKGGFAEIVVLWTAILLTIMTFFPVDLLAAALLIPYIAWVTIAAYLNFTIWRLNRPAPAK